MSPDMSDEERKTAVSSIGLCPRHCEAAGEGERKAILSGCGRISALFFWLVADWLGPKPETDRERNHS